MGKCSNRSAADDPDGRDSAASARMFHMRTVIGDFCGIGMSGLS